jgi:hypothetical protein
MLQKREQAPECGSNKEGKKIELLRYLAGSGIHSLQEMSGY